MSLKIVQQIGAVFDLSYAVVVEETRFAEPRLAEKPIFELKTAKPVVVRRRFFARFGDRKIVFEASLDDFKLSYWFVVHRMPLGLNKKLTGELFIKAGTGVAPADFTSPEAS